VGADKVTTPGAAPGAFQRGCTTEADGWRMGSSKGLPRDHYPQISREGCSVESVSQLVTCGGVSMSADHTRLTGIRQCSASARMDCPNAGKMHGAPNKSTSEVPPATQQDRGRSACTGARDFHPIRRGCLRCRTNNHGEQLRCLRPAAGALPGSEPKQRSPKPYNADPKNPLQRQAQTESVNSPATAS
jgi:hypothetical protein